MANPSMIAAERLKATRALDSECVALAEAIGIDPPAKAMKSQDPNMVALRQLQANLDFMRRLRERLKLAECEGEDQPAEEPQSPGQTGQAADEADASDETPKGDDVVMYGHPLSYYRPMTSEEILAIDGIGEARRDKILEALGRDPA